MQGKHNGQIASHLIANAVSKAMARRNQALETEDLLALSDSEAGAIKGGVASIDDPTTTMLKAPVVITAGAISIPEPEVM